MGGGDIGTRVREVMGSAMPGVPQAQVAQRVGMAPDAFSRALNGKRAFSSIELARLADLLGADIHWLITGELDPNRIAFVARHRFDFETGARDVPGRETDTTILDDGRDQPHHHGAGARTSSSPGPCSPWQSAPWLRPVLRPARERLFCHVYGRGKGQAQVIRDWPYSFVAAREAGRTSWTALLDASDRPR